MQVKSFKSIDFSTRAGQCNFTENGKLKDLNSKDLIRVEYHQGLIQISEGQKIIGDFRKVNFIGWGIITLKYKQLAMEVLKGDMMII